MVTIGNDTSGNAAGMYLLQVYVARSTLNETISVMAHGEKNMGRPTLWGADTCNVFHIVGGGVGRGGMW